MAARSAGDERTTSTMGGRARWATLASLGLVLAAVGPLLMLLAGVAWGLDVGEDVAFFLITAVIALVGAALFRRPATWSKIIGIVSAVLVAGALFWTVFGLPEPDSFFDFVPGVLVVPGVLIAIVAGIASILAQRRDRITGTAIGGERRAIQVVLAAVVVLAVVSGILTLTGQESVDDAGSAALTVEMSDFEFGEASYQVAGGTLVLVQNDDPFRHTFTVDALDIDVDLSPGSEGLVTIPGEPGDYVLYCEPHTSDPDDPSEDDMAARLQVS